MCPNDPDATKKLKECEKAVMKLKFEEAIALPESQRRSVAESIDFHSIGTTMNMVSYASIFILSYFPLRTSFFVIWFFVFYYSSCCHSIKGTNAALIL